MKKCLYLVLIFLISHKLLISQIDWNNKEANLYANHYLSKLSWDEKIAQLIFQGIKIDAKDSKIFKSFKNQLDTLCPGGIILLKMNSQDYVNLREISDKCGKPPIIFTMDGEWGLGMRFTDFNSLPRFMTISATGDDSLFYYYGKIIGRHFSLAGIPINYTPVLDINDEPLNPVIGTRAISDNPLEVIKRAELFINGLNENNVLPVIKHFPGHGNTTTDSHYNLPFLDMPIDVFKSKHLLPFSYFINKNVPFLMVGHLSYPAYTHDSLPATVNPIITKNLLKDTLHFNGLVFSDALNMKALADLPYDSVIIKALNTGIDILLLPENPYKVVSIIKQAVKDKKLDSLEIENKVKKILIAKYFIVSEFPLNNYKHYLTNKYINSYNAQIDSLSKMIYSKAITLLKNDDALPLQFDYGKIAMLNIVNNKPKYMDNIWSRYFYFDNYSLKDTSLLHNNLNNYDYLFVNLFVGSMNNNLGRDSLTIDWLEKISKQHKVILNIIGQPFILAKFKNTDNFAAITITYDIDSLAISILAEKLVGNSSFQGKLPIAINENFYKGKGLHTEIISNIIKFNNPPLGNIPEIDNIMQEALLDKTFPGAVVLAIKNKEIIYYKTFGQMTYDAKAENISRYTLYDLASLTKPLATSLAIMKLYEEGEIDIHASINKYIPELHNTNLGKIKIDRIMTHSAGLPPFINFFEIYSPAKCPELYSKLPNSNYYQVADSLFINKTIKDSILIYLKKNITPNPNIGTVYSDIGFILLKYAIENITKMGLDEYVYQNFYKPLNIKRLCYLPLNKYSKKEIAPTEYDSIFRKQLIWGYVHDGNAALLGGISGHAGLFGNAESIAILLQMLLDSGEYGGTKVLKQETIQKFTSVYFDKNRRGLGFDKPALNGQDSPACALASPQSYGHYGFTGTMFWVDPQYDLIYIFLSNRVYPTSQNTKISQKSIRTKVQQAIYESFID
jgi:beta-glucosidase-like glycosyl hydrolase/CubicO group peptidase (beta-lactamase class C family)